MTPIAEEMLADLGADTVEWRANYDATLDEPVVLPSRIPQLLMNGSTGIAVGMATNIPPHNLGEVARRAGRADRRSRDSTCKGLLKHIKGPDFPTGGELLSSRAELRTVYETGAGRAAAARRVQARAAAARHAARSSSRRSPTR